MQIWSIHGMPRPSHATPTTPPQASPTAPTRAAAHDIGAALVACIARPDFAVRALGELNRALPVAWWTVYRVFDDQPPQLFAQASHAAPDIALDCWRLYRNGLYRGDAHFAEACDRASRDTSGDTRTVMSHCRADDFSRAHRERIYVAHSLSERLSVVGAERDGEGSAAQLAINLYRHRAQPGFAPAELDRVLGFAGTLLAAVQRHIELDPSEATKASPAQRLLQQCPQLTARELAVCERLLRGLTFEGIAADLALSPATAKTYRNRAFERLGIHHRNELFALVFRSAAT